MKKTLLLLLIMVSLKMHAQTTILKGTVLDAQTREPLAGANITIKGKLTGTITDGQGNFRLNTSVKFPVELIISSLGFQKQEIQVISVDNSISVEMSQKNELMD
jgi:iron complex outermembrane recepter protein